MLDLPRDRPGVLPLGISGFGRLAQNYYAPALRRLSGARVIAVADPMPACRAAAEKLLPGVRVYESHDMMLGREALAGLLVASPPSAHLAAWNAAAAAYPALAVFMEKPFVLEGQLVEANASPRAARHLMLDFNRRFWPRYQRIADLIRHGDLGKLLSIEIKLQVDVLKWLSVTQHRLDKGEGGALYDLGSQMLDLAALIAGQRPTTVAANATSKRWESDHVVVDLTMPCGANVRCLLSYDASTCERITVAGSDARVQIADPNMALHVRRNDFPASGAMRRVKDFFTLARHAVLRHTSMSRFTIECALREFVERLRDGRPFSPGFDDAAFSATLLEAASRSLASGRAEPVVPVPAGSEVHT